VAAAAAAPGAVFENAGQDCCARSRILVERSVYDRFLGLLVDAAADFTVGHPEDAGAFMGPLVSAAHRDKVASFVDDDTEVAYRGSVPAGPGFWYPPTIVTNAARDSRIANDEIFGPIVAVMPFDDEADAAELANATIYGLSGSIWTRDSAKALRMVKAVQSGTLSVNSNSSVRYATPFGGFKQSGMGRDLSLHALDHYSETKTVYIATGD
jgi:betaine-aldehyde dehydrogenase